VTHHPYSAKDPFVSYANSTNCGSNPISS